MRVSIRKDDSGYRPDACLFEVLLNGTKINDAITADEEQRYVVRYKRTRGGDFIIDRDTDSPEETREYGDVTLVEPPETKNFFTWDAKANCWRGATVDVKGALA